MTHKLLGLMVVALAWGIVGWAGPSTVPTTRTITAGTGLTGGGDFSDNRTLALANTAVTLGAYGDATHIPTFTVDQQGRLVAAGSTTFSAPAPANLSAYDLLLKSDSNELPWIQAYGTTDTVSVTRWAAADFFTIRNMNDTSNAGPTTDRSISIVTSTGSEWFGVGSTAGVRQVRVNSQGFSGGFYAVGGGGTIAYTDGGIDLGANGQGMYIGNNYEGHKILSRTRNVGGVANGWGFQEFDSAWRNFVFIGGIEGSSNDALYGITNPDTYESGCVPFYDSQGIRIANNTNTQAAIIAPTGANALTLYGSLTVTGTLSAGSGGGGITVNTTGTAYPVATMNVTHGADVDASLSGTTLTITVSSPAVVSGGYLDRPLGFSTLFFRPATSDRMYCYENGAWIQKRIPGPGLTCPATGLTADTDYWAYVSDLTGNDDQVDSLVLDTTSPVTITGIPVKAATLVGARQLCVGRCRTNGSGAITTYLQDASTQLIANNWNRRFISLTKAETTASWTYQGTWRPMNNSTANRLQFVSTGQCSTQAVCQLSGTPVVNSNIACGIGLDSTTVQSAQTWGVADVVTSNPAVVARYQGIPSEGFHYLQALEGTYTNTAGACTFYGQLAGGTGGVPVCIQSGITAEVVQ